MPNSTWVPLAGIESSAPAALLSWLAEPGLLTARVRELCGDGMQFRMLGPLRTGSLPAPLQARLAVTDTSCLLREIEFRHDVDRLIFAQTIIPASTVAGFPWLRELGEAPLGEALREAGLPLERDPLEFRSLSGDHPLARAAVANTSERAICESFDPAVGASPEGAAQLWARRAVYRLAGHPMLVQEVFLPALLRAQLALRAVAPTANQPAQIVRKVNP